MAPSFNALLDRLTGGKGDKLLRFSTVSIIGVVVTQTLLVLTHAVLGIEAIEANVLSVSISAAPVFLLNKRWVWGKTGRSHMRREVLPFWGLTLLGLALSTGLVGIADRVNGSTLLVMGANIAGFGVVWVAKFFFLDAVIFAALPEDEPEPGSVADHVDVAAPRS